MVYPDGTKNEPSGEQALTAADVPTHPSAAPLRRVTSVALVFLFLFAALKLYSNLPPDIRGYGNFPPFYSAGVILKEGGRHVLYDYNVQREVEFRLFPVQAHKWQEFVYFYHPPYQAVFLLPFAYLSYPTALILWMLPWNRGHVTECPNSQSAFSGSS
jgi:hypothetical protein